MIKDILKALSDTELVAISKEMCDPNIPNQVIINQLLSKADIDKDKISESYDDLLFGMDVTIELCNRLISSNMEPNKYIYK